MTEDKPSKVPRFFSCLIKGPLGCLAFAVGAAAIAILLLPPALGRWIDRRVERWFEERHGGSLELDSAEGRGTLATIRLPQGSSDGKRDADGPQREPGPTGREGESDAGA